jgi:hypothetical protein
MYGYAAQLTEREAEKGKTSRDPSSHLVGQHAPNGPDRPVSVFGDKKWTEFYSTRDTVHQTAS